MGEHGLDPREVLAGVKRNHRVLTWQPLPPDQAREPIGGNREDLASVEYLHHNWSRLPHHYEPGDRRSLRAWLVTRFGRLTYRVLVPYLRDERLLLSHLVRTNEALAKRCEQLAARVDELSRDMIDRQVAEAENLSRLALWLEIDRSPSFRAEARASGDGAGDDAPPGAMTRLVRPRLGSAPGN